MSKVCHISSAHQSHDIRIFVKECRSLAKAGHDVSFVVFGESEELDGVSIVGLGKPPASRRERMVSGARRASEVAAALRADIYHLHDPELLLHARKLKDLGAKVIFDSHEDVPGQVMEKNWIPHPIRRAVALAYRIFETRVARSIDAVVAATPHIADQFAGRAKKIATVNNYPVLDDIVYQKQSFAKREKAACYTGGVNDIRGGAVMLQAMDNVKGTLVIAGPCETDLTAAPVGADIEYLGVLPHEAVNDVYANSRVGVILYQPAENHCESQPNKLFEYMAAGLPVVASDFPLWREVIEGSECGICVSPADVKAAGAAIAFLLDNPDSAQAMGAQGRRAIEEKYNWKREESSLVGLYDQLLS